MSDIGNYLGASLLETGRNAFQSSKYGRIGLSPSSRQQLESIFNNATTLFNTLYTNAETQEANNIKQILALRSKYKYLVSENVTATAASTTTGTKVDTAA